MNNNSKLLKMKKTIFTLILLAFAGFVLAQTTYNIPVKTSHFTGSDDHDTTISIQMGDIVKLINYGSSNIFGYWDNLNLTPVLTSSISTGGVIRQWTIGSLSYTHVDVMQSPSGAYGRRVYLNISAGIGEDNLSSIVSVSPCPANEYITIDFNCLNNITENLILIYDLNGRMLLQQSIENAKTKIDISSLSKGIYFVKVCNKDGATVKKFIKE
jgi:hypothetical protein